MEVLPADRRGTAVPRRPQPAPGRGDPPADVRDHHRQAREDGEIRERAAAGGGV